MGLVKHGEGLANPSRVAEENFMLSTTLGFSGRLIHWIFWIFVHGLTVDLSNRQNFIDQVAQAARKIIDDQEVVRR